MEQINLTPAEAMLRLRIGRTKLYELIAAGTLPSIRVGKKIIIPVKAIEAFESGEQPGGRR